MFGIGFGVGLTLIALILILLIRSFGAYAGAGVLVLVVLAAALRWPTATAVGFIAFLPVNRFAIMLVYHFTHSVLVTKGVEFWADAVLGALLVRVSYDLFFTPGRKHKIVPLDILAAFFVLLGIIYLVYPGPLNTQLWTRLQGFRADTTLLLAYFVGRGMHLNRARLRWILMAIIPGTIIVGAVAVFQFVQPTVANNLFDYLGYSDFVKFSGNTGDEIAVRSRDLPGADTLPRASSLLLSDLALSFYQVLTVSLAAAMFYGARRLRSAVVTGLFLALMLATMAMTVSRSAIGSSVGAITVAAFAARAVGRSLVFGLLTLAATALVLISGFIKISTVQALVNFQDPSALQHEYLIVQSIAIVEQYPLGRGLGTAGNIGQQQLGALSITNESWYLQIGTEMGVLTMVVYLALVAVVMVIALYQFWKVNDYWLRTITLTVAITAGAMLVLGNVLHAWENTPLSMVFWLFAGIAVRARDLEASADYNDGT